MLFGEIIMNQVHTNQLNQMDNSTKFFIFGMILMLLSYGLNSYISELIIFSIGLIIALSSLLIN
jgi:hypothetical protein